MHHGHDYNLVWEVSEKHSERKSLCQATAHVEMHDLVEQWIYPDIVDCFLNGNEESLAKIGLLLFIIDGSGNHLGFRLRMEFDRFHPSEAKAVLKTDSASRR